MKHFIVLSFFLLATSTAFSQKEDFWDDIANKTCECINNKDFEGKTDTEIKMDLGLCIFSSIEGYEKELKKFFNTDFEIIEHAERLGEIVGMRMAITCPEVFERFMSPGLIDEFEEKNEKTIEVSTKTTVGEVKKINENEFISFDIQTARGVTEKFYWMSEVQSDFDFQNNYEDLEGASVYIEYEKKYLFDPRIKEYKSFNVITNISKTDE